MAAPLRDTPLPTRPPSLLARLGLPLVLLFCAMQAWHPLSPDYDFWAHAAVGRWIENHGTVPRHGLFLWSAPHYPWVYHSWLSQWFLYKLLALTGPLGVVIFTTAASCLVFGLLWRLWRKRGGPAMPAVAPLLFFIAIFVSTPRFVPRQELLTAVLLVFFLGWQLAWNDRRAAEAHDARRARLFEPRSIGVLLLFALWINLHALVLLPLVLLWAAAVGDTLQYRFDRRALGLLLLAVLCSAATLCNPWGWGYWAAAGVLKPGSQASNVQEWWPVWRGWPAMLPFVIGEALLVAAALWGWAANPNRRWCELLWVLGTAALFIKSRRLMWILAIVCLVVMASNARFLDSRLLWARWRAATRQAADEGLPAGLRRIGHVGIFTLLALILALFAPLAVSNLRAPGGLSPKTPTAAANTILKNGVPPRLFVDYEYSSYFHWRLNGPDKKGIVPDAGLHPLYIDLFNAYPDKAMDHYFAILQAKPGGLKLLDSLGINTVILGQPHFAPVKDESGRVIRNGDGIVNYLDHNPGWKRAFSDNNARIWVRRVPRAAAKGAGNY